MRAVEYAITKIEADKENQSIVNKTEIYVNKELPLKDLYINPDDNLNPRYHFDSFIVGSFNELAYAENLDEAIHEAVYQDNAIAAKLYKEDDVEIKRIQATPKPQESSRESGDKIPPAQAVLDLPPVIGPSDAQRNPTGSVSVVQLPERSACRRTGA